jgi:pyruvate,water dikinase
MSDDYPVLLAPGQPGLRANVTPEEIIRYAPKSIDVINLKTNRFETIDARILLREHGETVPGVRRMISMVEHNHIRPPQSLEPDWAQDDYVITFDGLIREGRFINQIGTLLNGCWRTPSIRPSTSSSPTTATDFFLAAVPRAEPFDDARPRGDPAGHRRATRLLFTANRYISNGQCAGHHVTSYT